MFYKVAITFAVMIAIVWLAAPVDASEIEEIWSSENDLYRPVIRSISQGNGGFRPSRSLVTAPFYFRPSRRFKRFGMKMLFEPYQFKIKRSIDI